MTGEAAVLRLLLSADTLFCVVRILVDGGYTGEPFSQHVAMILGAAVEVAQRSELHRIAVIPKRWMVERSFAWLDKCRRLWKNCKRKLHTSPQMVVLAFIRVWPRKTLNRLLDPD
jgi:transposase